MTVAASSEVSSMRSAWRTIVFPILAGLFALGGWFALEGLTEGLMPWVILGCPGCSPDFNPEARRWFGAEHGAIVGILFSGSLIGLLRRPSTRPVLLQFYVLGHLVFLFGLAVWLWQPLAPSIKPSVFVLFLVVLAVLIATYPKPRALVDFSRRRPISRPLLALTLAAIVALAPSTWQALLHQLQAQGAVDRWAEAIDLSVLLVLASWFAASRRAGWRELGLIVGVAYLYLGAAALTVPDQMGSWGIAGGALSLIGGLAYIAATLVEAGRGASDVDSTT